MGPNVWSSLAWFALILAAIPVALWLLKRTPMGGAATARGGLRSIAALPLSTSQRIVTIEVGSGAARRWLVLGVTPQAITTLHTLEPEADPPDADPATAPSFVAAFARVLDKRRDTRDAAP